MDELMGQEMPEGEHTLDCLSIRQHFAVQALQGLLAGGLENGAFDSRQDLRNKVIDEAVALADGLLKRLGESA